MGGRNASGVLGLGTFGTAVLAMGNFANEVEDCQMQTGREAWSYMYCLNAHWALDQIDLHGHTSTEQQSHVSTKWSKVPFSRVLVPISYRYDRSRLVQWLIWTNTCIFGAFVFFPKHTTAEWYATHYWSRVGTAFRLLTRRQWPC